MIADGKRGDIGSTARAYAAAYLEPRGEEPALADALTVNTVSRRASRSSRSSQACRLHGAGIFCLVRTSNAGAATSRTLTLSDGRRVWQHVAELVAEWGADLVGERGLSSVGAVVGATHPRAVAEARKLLPQAVLLLPGVGAQGATPADVARAFTSGPASALVTASRSVIFAYRAGARTGARRPAPRPRGCAGGLGGLRLVSARRTPAGAVAAPVAFLLAVTIAVVLVRAALDRRRRGRRRRGHDDGAGDDRRRAARTGKPTTAPADAQFYKIQAGDTLAVDRRRNTASPSSSSRS